MTRKVVLSTRSILVFRRIFLLHSFSPLAGNPHSRIEAVTRLKQKFTEHAQTNCLSAPPRRFVTRPKSPTHPKWRPIIRRAESCT